MIEISLLFVFFIIFYFLYKKDKKDRERIDNILKTFENTILTVVTSLEKTNNKFYEMAGKIEISHFKQLEKQMDKQERLFERSIDKFIALLEEKDKELKEIDFEKISRIDKGEPNSIEKEEEIENPLEEFPHIPIEDIKNIRFEEEEEILPLS